MLGGILYTAGGVRAHGGVLFFLLASGSVLAGSLRERSRHLAIVLIFRLVYNIYKGHDVLSMYRFFVPILPLTYGLGLTAVGGIVDTHFDRGKARKVGLALVMALAFGTFGWKQADTCDERRNVVLAMNAELRSLDSRGSRALVTVESAFTEA